MHRTDYWIALAALAVAVLVLAVLPGDNSLAQTRDKPNTAAGEGLVSRGGSGGKPRAGRLFSILMGQDQRLSTSKTFALLWTLTLAYMLVAIVTILARHSVSGGVNALLSTLDPTYLLLLGGPFASLVLAKAIVTSKIAKGTLVKTTGDGVPRLSDLTGNDAGQTDLVDFQYCLFNLIAMGFVLSQFLIAGTGAIPDIPTLFAWLTLGPSLVYLTNKAATDNTPVLDPPSPRVARIGQDVTLYGTNVPPSGREDPHVMVHGVRCRVTKATPSTVTFQAPPDLDPLVPDEGSTAELLVELVTADVTVRSPVGLTLVSDRPVVTGFAQPSVEDLREPVTALGRYFLPTTVINDMALPVAAQPTATGPFVYAQLPGAGDFDRCQVAGSILDGQLTFTLPTGWSAPPAPVDVAVVVRRDGKQSRPCLLRLGPGSAPRSFDGAKRAFTSVGAPGSVRRFE